MQEVRMVKRSRLWKIAAVIFTLLNVGGVVYGVANADPAHAVGHIALQLVGFAVWRMTARIRDDDIISPSKAVDEQRIEYLQQSVDAIALEVERIGEKQRFMDKLRVEGGQAPPLKSDK
jgi:hypothetical protein